MKRYRVTILKLVKTFCFFVLFKITFDQLKIDFGASSPHQRSSYKDILMEAMLFSVAYLLITTKYKFKKGKQNPKNDLP
jgi:hypothetical protein